MFRLRLPILISLAIHLTLIGAVVLGALFIVHDEAPQLGGIGGAGGEVVDVWLAGPRGETFGERAALRGTEERARAKARRRILRRKTTKREEGETTRRTVVHAGAGTSAGVGSGLGTGVGSGAGVGTGSSVGAGSGGPSVLAEIWKRINRNKYYPSMARRQGLEGKPKVTFVIDGDGSIARVHLAQSCGSSVLDNAAIETIRRAAPLPFYAGPITVTVRYSLEE